MLNHDMNDWNLDTSKPGQTIQIMNDFAKSGKPEGPDGTQWIDGTHPFSTRFQDNYYSRTDGQSETRHVFLDGNKLAERMAASRHFTIAELGFGTGLNYLETVRLWRSLAHPGMRLTYVSFELYPLSRGEMSLALSSWPDIAALAGPLVDTWHPDLEILELEHAPDVALTLFMSDANIRLPQLEFEADAWFLDGFAPSRNPQMWNETLIGEVFRHTRPGGTFATYTAAGWVRRNLQSAGFHVTRQKGHAGKREMMVGTRPLET
ncbi:MAG: tRNA (5-methylaminomethyl-2-thiouridine)(34)-methyltransferase MnmD [Rhizobiaceae bacterium]